MPKKPAIRWRKSDVEKLKHEVQRFNAKINRTAKRHPEIADILPNKINVKELMQKITTRNEFNREIKSLQRFSKRGAEKPIVSKTGLRITKWERQEIAYKVAQINRERTKELKRVMELPVMTRGTPTGLKRSQMGEERLTELRKKQFDINKIRPGKEWELFKKSVEKQATDTYRELAYEQYKQNYFQAIYNNFGSYADELIDQLKDVPAKDIVDMYYKEQEASIDFPYDPQDVLTKLDIIKNIWQPVIDKATKSG